MGTLLVTSLYVSHHCRSYLWCTVTVQGPSAPSYSSKQDIKKARSLSLFAFAASVERIIFNALQKEDSWIESWLEITICMFLSYISIKQLLPRNVRIMSKKNGINYATQHNVVWLILFCPWFHHRQLLLWLILQTETHCTLYLLKSRLNNARFL